jgi:hypothetical protein
MEKKASSYRPGKRQTHFVLSPADMRPLGMANPRAVNHDRPSRPVCFLLASFGE